MSRKNWLVLILMVMAGCGIFAYSMRDQNLHLIMAELKRMNWEWFLVAVACICLYMGLEGVVDKLFLANRYPDFTWRDALRLPPIEQLFNGITPFSTGGQPAQLVALLQSGVEGGMASSVLLMKFVVFQSMIVISFLISLLIGFHYIAEKLQALSLLVILGFVVHLSVIVALLLVMYWYGFTKRAVNLLIEPASWFMNSVSYQLMRQKLNEKIDTFYRESIKMKSEYGKLTQVSVVTIAQLFFYYAIPYFIMLALGIHGINFMMVMSLHVLIFMIISLFPIPGGTGGAEYSFAVLFSSFMHSSSKLVLAMILWRILTYYFCMFAGMFCVVLKPDRVKQQN